MKGAIFDVDGTLLNSMSVWWDLLIDFYAKHGRELPDDVASSYKELTLKESIPIIKDDLGLDMSPEEMSKVFQESALWQYENALPLKKDADKYLKKLHEAGVKIAIATSGYKELCKSAFTRLGVWQYIDECAFSSEVGVNKSNPDVYLLAAKRLGVAPEECTVFEDITSGIIGASKGGFKTCAVYDDTNADETDSLKEIADMYISSWTELL